MKKEIANLLWFVAMHHEQELNPIFSAGTWCNRNNHMGFLSKFLGQNIYQIACNMTINYDQVKMVSAITCKNNPIQHYILECSQLCDKRTG